MTHDDNNFKKHLESGVSMCEIESCIVSESSTDFLAPIDTGIAYVQSSNQ